MLKVYAAVFFFLSCMRCLHNIHVWKFFEILSMDACIKPNANDDANKQRCDALRKTDAHNSPIKQDRMRDER